MTDDFKYISFTEVVARKKLGAPDSWEMCGWELIGRTRDCLVKGGIPRPLKSGKNKGMRTWRDSEISKVCVTDAEEYQAKLDYEQRTGACYLCQGRSKMYIGWNCDTGNQYAPCTRCGSTGRSPETKSESLMLMAVTYRRFIGGIMIKTQSELNDAIAKAKIMDDLEFYAHCTSGCVLITLAYLSNFTKNGFCCSSTQEQIKDMSDYSLRTIQESIKHLNEIGLITIIKSGRGNIYKLHPAKFKLSQKTMRAITKADDKPLSPFLLKINDILGK